MELWRYRYVLFSHVLSFSCLSRITCSLNELSDPPLITGITGRQHCSLIEIHFLTNSCVTACTACISPRMRGHNCINTLSPELMMDRYDHRPLLWPGPCVAICLQSQPQEWETRHLHTWGPPTVSIKMERRWPYLIKYIPSLYWPVHYFSVNLSVETLTLTIADTAWYPDLVLDSVRCGEKIPGVGGSVIL